MRSSTSLGRVVAGRYRVVSPLGEGTCGTVWNAVDLMLGIPVALKLLRGPMRADRQHREAFEREWRLCERMLSPNVVRVLAAGADGADVPYIVYELLEGESLEQRLVGGKELALDELEDVVIDVARGLARAHSLQITHRDIKPSNIFLTHDDRGRPLTKILDFGVASLRGAATGLGAAGTLGYMAPEVLFGEASDARADLYGIAAVTYECLTGAGLTRTASIPELVAHFSRPDYRAPSVRLRTSARLATYFDPFFRVALARKPEDRFPNARSFAEELCRVLKLAKMPAASDLGRIKLREATRASPRALSRRATPAPFDGDEHGAERPPVSSKRDTRRDD